MLIFPGIFDSTKPKPEHEEAGEYYRTKNGMKSSDFSNQMLEYFSLFLPKKQVNEQIMRPINRANHQEAKDASVGPTSAKGWYSVDGNQDQVLRLVPKYYEDQNLDESPPYQEIKASRGQKQFQDSDVKLNQILEMFKLLPNLRFKPDGRTRYGHIRYG